MAISAPQYMIVGKVQYHIMEKIIELKQKGANWRREKREINKIWRARPKKA